MDTELLYKIALTLVPNIGCVQARQLLQFLPPKEIFNAKKSTLEKIEGLGTVRINNIIKFSGFDTAEKEIAFIEKYKISPLFINDEAYPRRLLNCYDSPTLLYYRGNADLNASKIIAVVGTRNNTEYGKAFTEKLVGSLAAQNVLIVSGLAYGIDAIAHKASLKFNTPTVGVLAHGLDKIYPAEHTALAKEMLHQGGLLTEFKTKTKPDRFNFPSRNRIVAGMSDATVVIETDVKGGSMITAELANGYNKDVFALPGRIGDKKSNGCNSLIKNNKAILINDANDIPELMGWEVENKKSKKKTRELFIELTADEKIIIGILNKRSEAGIDEININSGLSSSAVAVAILNLEMQNLIQSLPGKIYRLN